VQTIFIGLDVGELNCYFHKNGSRLAQGVIVLTVIQEVPHSNFCCYTSNTKWGILSCPQSH